MKACWGTLGSLVALIFSCQGLQLSIERAPGAPTCAHLTCSNVAHPDESIFSTTSIKILDVTQPQHPLELASISATDSSLHIAPGKANDITGTGSVSRYQADITLNFSNETDCLYASFQCVLAYVNVQGEIDSISQSAGSSGNGSCCAALTYQLSKLTSRLDAVESEMLRLRLNQTSLEQIVALLRQQNIILEAKVDDLSAQVANSNQPATTPGPPSTTPRPPATPAATTAQVVTGIGECNKGAVHTSPRELFLLWGRLPALCDTETDGGGWVIIQRRIKGDMDFYKPWADYKNGFGTPATDYWLGLDAIHNLTAQGYNEIRIDMELNGVKYFAHYSIFSVDGEILNYKLTVNGYSGSAGDSFTYHSGMLFTTSDRDHDKDYRNCAVVHTSAWWYDSCYQSNLNGIWGKNGDGGVIWHGIERSRSLSLTEMKVRRN